MMTEGMIFFAFVTSYFLTGLLRYFALKLCLLDIPNERSSHLTPTPRGGGLAIVLVFFICLVCSYIFTKTSPVVVMSFLGGGGLVAGIGFLDDYGHVSPKWRLVVHFIAVFFVLYCLAGFPQLVLSNFNDITNLLWGMITAVALVWGLNLFNFMDGIDGIAAVETITVTGAAAIILWLNGADASYVQLLIVFSAATLGFLVWNWPPAKIFMGDTCSGFLGFSIGVFAIVTSGQHGINIWSWIILYSVFWVDATITLLRRIVRGECFYKAHRNHAYQIMARRLSSHKKVTIGVLLVNVFWLLPIAFAASRYVDYCLPLTILAAFPLSIGVVNIGAAQFHE